MNRLPLVVALVLLAAPAWAQTDATRQLRSSIGQHVFVIDATSREWQGRLIGVMADSLEIEGESGIRAFPLDRVKRVDSDGDRLRDGVIKGAIFGAIVGGLSAGNGHGPRMVLAGAGVYALVGLGLDSAN